MYGCHPGQGEYGKALKSLRLCNLVECQKACKDRVDCKGLDFAGQCQDDACRLFPKNTPRESKGLDSRIYCDQGKSKIIRI